MSEKTQSQLISPGARLKALLEATVIVAIIAGTIIIFKSFGGLEGYSGELGLLLAVGCATFLLRREGRSWRDLGLKKPESWRSVLVLVPLGYFGVFVAFFLGQLIMVQGFGVEPPSVGGNDIEGDLWGYLIRLTVISWVTAAFFEEMIARGFLMDRFFKVFSGIRGAALLAALAQAIIFGAAHPGQGATGMVIVGMVGLIFGLIYLRAKRNLWPVILTHGIADSISFTFLYLGVTPG